MGSYEVSLESPLKTNGERMNDGDRVFDLYQVQLTDEERYDNRGCEAISDVDLILPEYYEDREGPTKNFELGRSHQGEESLCKLRIEKGERHGERERVLRVVAQGEVRTEAQRCA